ncbi:MAG: hypothetical protein U0223_07180, partial [Nitrospira sp.]
RGALRIMARSTHCKRYQLLRRGVEERKVVEPIFATLDGRTCVVLDATYCFITQRILDQRMGRRIPS